MEKEKKQWNSNTKEETDTKTRYKKWMIGEIKTQKWFTKGSSIARDEAARTEKSSALSSI